MADNPELIHRLFGITDDETERVFTFVNRQIISKRVQEEDHDAELEPLPRFKGNIGDASELSQFIVNVTTKEQVSPSSM